jgi:hypothetical protein
MPLFGIKTSNNITKDDLAELFSRENLEFHYQLVSIVEIKWLIIRAGKNDDKLRDKLERAFSDALRYLEDNKNIVGQPFDSDIINDISYELQRFGHQDYFDTLILAGAILSSDFLLSEDDAFSLLLEKQKKMKSGFYNIDLKVQGWGDFKILIGT